MRQLFKPLGCLIFTFFQIEKWVKLVAQKMNKVSQITDKDLKDMAMKHYMAVHTFFSDDARRAYFATPNSKTEKEWGQMTNAVKGAKCRQTWTGTEEFFFCHWEAESEEAIHQAIRYFGVDKYHHTALYQMHQFVSWYRNSDEIAPNPPLEDV